MKILVTCPPMLGQIDRFLPIFSQYHNLEVTQAKVTQTLSEEELIDLLPGHAGWIVGDDPVTRQVLENGLKGGLKAVIKWGIGTDNIDFEAVEEFNLKFSNTPGMFGEEVADVAIGYIVGLSRQLFFIDREVRKGSWPKPAGNSLKDKNIAVIGGGDIGYQIVKRVNALGMHTHVYDPNLNDAKNSDFELLQWPEKLGEMDFIVFACSLNDGTYHLFNTEAVKLVKQGVRLINVSRGSVVEERALLNGLESGVIQSAALDVMEIEPLSLSSNLLKYDQCVFGSHNSSNTIEGVIRASEQSINLLFKYLDVE